MRTKFSFSKMLAILLAMLMLILSGCADKPTMSDSKTDEVTTDETTVSTGESIAESTTSVSTSEVTEPSTEASTSTENVTSEESHTQASEAVTDESTAIEVTPINLAIGKPVCASSENYNGSIGTESATRAIDGDSNSWWCANNYLEKPHWWMIDLEAQTDISRIVIKFEVPFGIVYKFALQGSVDGESWTDIADYLDNTGAGGVFEINCDEQYRYLRVYEIEADGGKWSAIAEFEAYSNAADMPENPVTPEADEEPGSEENVTEEVSSTDDSQGKVVTADYSKGFELLEKMGAGWNFGNTLDAPNEGDWSPKATKQNVKSVKKMGFGAIRLPVTWNNHIGPAPEYKIDEEFMDRVEEVVDWILDEDLYCILNLHHDGSWIYDMSVNHDEVLDKYTKVWEQIAERFKNKSDKLLFESTNEQGFSGDGSDPAEQSYELMNELNLKFVGVVRSSGGKNSERFLCLPSVWTSAHAVERMELPEGDGNILVAFHYYAPWSFTVNAWGAAYWGSESDKTAMKNDLLAAYNAFDGKVPMYIGEYGAWFSHLAYRTYYTEYLVSTARSLGMATFMWDVGEVMDRNTNKWNDDIVPRMAVSAGNGHSNSFVKPLELYIKKGNIADTELEIEFRGNTLKTIKDGWFSLSKKDYTVTDGGVILSKSYLEELATGDFGEKTVLHFEFSDGVDYELKIIYCDTPTLNREIDKGILFEGAKLPISWNGNRVATIRGVKAASGQSANTRESWTKYFKMGDDFWFEDGEVYLTEEFRRMITEDIILTFELFSGETFDITIKA